MSPKIGYILRPTRRWPEKSLEELLAEFKQAQKELEEAEELARPYNQLVQQAWHRKQMLDWEIYNLRVERESERRRATMRSEASKEDPIGCPAEHRGAWGRKGRAKSRPRPIKVTKEMEEAL